MSGRVRQVYSCFTFVFCRGFESVFRLRESGTRRETRSAAELCYTCTMVLSSGCCALLWHREKEEIKDTLDTETDSDTRSQCRLYYAYLGLYNLLLRST